MADYLWTRSEIDPPLSLVIVLSGTRLSGALVFEKCAQWPELSSLPVKLQIDESAFEDSSRATVVHE